MDRHPETESVRPSAIEGTPFDCLDARCEFRASASWCAIMKVRFRTALCWWLLASLLTATIIGHSLIRPLDHDEHQFVASASLLARDGLLPYRDYPYFHMPYLVFGDAMLFRLAGRGAPLLLIARLVSAACAVATVWLVATIPWRLHRAATVMERSARSIIAAAVLVTCPIFLAASGRAWNHDASELLLLIAALLMLGAIERRYCRPLPMLICGFLLGLSIGVRLTAFPAAVAFFGWLCADRSAPWRHRIPAAAALIAGIFIALLPCIWLYLLSPRGFIFGNFEYPTLNTAWRLSHGPLMPSTSPAGKVVYFFSRLVFSSGAGFLVALVLLAIWTLRSTIAREHHREMNFLATLILFLLVSSFAPSPLFLVYFYAPLPFVILWLCYAARTMPRQDRRIVLSAGAGVVGCIVCGLSIFRDGVGIFHPAQWVPTQIHASGVTLAATARGAAIGGPVITLAPILPLEGGLAIDASFATGPFALRVAPMMTASERAILHLQDADDLRRRLERGAPGIALLNVENPDEERQITAALPPRYPQVRRTSEWRFVVTHSGSRASLR